MKRTLIACTILLAAIGLVVTAVAQHKNPTTHAVSEIEFGTLGEFIAQREAPKFILVYRKRGISITQPWIHHAIPAQSLDEALALADSNDVDEESFVGVWQLGTPLDVSVTTEEKTVQKSERSKKWKKP